VGQQLSIQLPGRCDGARYGKDEEKEDDEAEKEAETEENEEGAAPSLRVGSQLTYIHSISAPCLASHEAAVALW
jgi:hypothetical protein